MLHSARKGFVKAYSKKVMFHMVYEGDVVRLLVKTTWSMTEMDYDLKRLAWPVFLLYINT